MLLSTQLKKRTLTFTIIGSILFTILTFWFLWKRQNSDIIKTQPKKGPIVEAIYSLGTVTARNQFHFKVGVPKTIQKLYITEGQQVSKGQNLVLLSDGITIRSPYNGTVTQLPFSEGENVFSDTYIVSVENMSDLYLQATLEQQGALRVKKGLPVQLSFETIREQKFSGTVTSVYPQKGQFIVRIEVKNLPTEILPGMTADIAIEISRHENAILIPAAAISNGVVIVERNRQREKIPVKIGSMDNEWAEITSNNIQPTDEVIIKK